VIADKYAPRLLGWIHALGAFGLGALAALGLAPTGLWFVTLLALSALFALFPFATRKRQAALWLWAFGTGYFGAGLRWLIEPFQVEAEIFGWMAPFALVLMAAGLALFWGAAGWLAAALGTDPRSRTLALGLMLAFTELARAYVLTGFPWAGLAQIWIDTPVAGLLAWIGPQGLGVLTIALALLPALGAPERLSALTAAPTLVLLAVVALVPSPPHSAPNPDAPIIRLVQPNAPQSEKWADGRWQEFFWRQVDATAAEPRPDLVVWPETAIPTLLHNSDEALAIIAEAARGVPVVFGVQRRDERLRYYNSLAVTGASGEVIQTYDKHHLVPFGEYMPFPGLFRRLGVQALAQRADGGFSPGPGPRLLGLPGIGSALPLICYEAVFPQHARVLGGRPRILLQLTNDAWFGLYAGPQQHLVQARMRAAEQGVPLVRAANTGISAVIDGRGRVTASLPLDVHGYLDAPLPPLLPATPYAKTGDWPAAAVILAGLAVLAATRRRASRR
jgi:apolipoprotein N-acyltransferase